MNLTKRNFKTLQLMRLFFLSILLLKFSISRNWNSGDKVESATEEFSKQYEYTGTAPTAKLQTILQGPSGALYYQGYADHNYNTVIIKEDTNRNIVWARGYYTLSIDSVSFIMDPQEEYLYTIESVTDASKYIKIMKYDTETGDDPLVYSLS